MKKLLCTLLFINILFIGFSQEALKSVEEEYYDFLSLTGVVENPVLGYRTLSDSVWNYNDIESFEENDDGTFTKMRTPGLESSANIWKNNNLGTRYTLWEKSAPDENWFANGLNQSVSARIYGPQWFNSYNSSVPYGYNDGGLWQGAGYNTSLTAGLRLEGYGFELTFKPQVSWSQNKDFDSNSDVYPSPYSFTFRSGNVGHPIDNVQRYGDSSLFNYDWGDTEVRWTWHTLTFGFGTQNPWLGPAYLNPMLGSNNAGGYFKVDAGLRKTPVVIPYINLNLGNIEGRIWVGRLEESDYFDFALRHEPRMLTAMSASYEPSFIPGFTFGLNRIFVTYWKAENLGYILRLFTTSRSNALASSGNDEDQKFSLFAQWAFPKVGFTIYGEYGRDDFSSDEKANPFHTAIYTLGAKQAIPLPFGLKSELNLEWNNFEMSQDFQLQWTYLGYYAHGYVNQGYTHNGQILGAGTGWAGNSQFVQYKVYYPKGFTAVKFHRYCPNNNSVFSQAVNEASDATNGPLYQKWYGTFETYFVFGLTQQVFITKDFSMNGEFNFIKIHHYNYTNNQINNFNLQLSAQYNL